MAACCQCRTASWLVPYYRCSNRACNVIYCSSCGTGFGGICCPRCGNTGASLMNELPKSTDAESMVVAMAVQEAFAAVRAAGARVGDVQADPADGIVIVDTPMTIWPPRNAARIRIICSAVSAGETSLAFHAESDDGIGLLCSAGRAIQMVIKELEAICGTPAPPPERPQPATAEDRGGDPFAFLTAQKAVAPDPPGRPGDAAVLVAWPGQEMVVDAKVSVSLAGQTRTGSFVKGFQFPFTVPPGTHSLVVKLPLRGGQTYPLDLAAAGSYRVDLAYSTLWGNFEKACSVRQEAAGREPPPLPAPQPTKWYVATDGKRSGPFTGAQLRSLAKAGTLKPQHLLWREGLDTWHPASRVQGLFT